MQALSEYERQVRRLSREGYIIDRVLVELTQLKADRADGRSGELTPGVRLDSCVQRITNLYKELQWIQ